MVSEWNENAVRYLLATTICPRCDAELDTQVCGACSADLSGPEGTVLWKASRRAADAVLERQRLIAELPTVRASVVAAAVTAGPRPTAPTAAATSATPPETSPVRCNQYSPSRAPRSSRSLRSCSRSSTPTSASGCARR